MFTRRSLAALLTLPLAACSTKTGPADQDGGQSFHPKDSKPSNGRHGYVMDVASVVPDEPGYREWCTAVSDGLEVRVYVDGVAQGYCEAANAVEGWVRRTVVSPDTGNVVADTARGEVLKEIVRGLVIIEATQPLDI